MKVDSKTFIAVVVTMVILLGGYFYLQKTKQERAYIAEIEMLKLISEHQALEITVAKQKIEFANIHKGAKQQVINLNPSPPQELNQ